MAARRCSARRISLACRAFAHDRRSAAYPQGVPALGTSARAGLKCARVLVSLGLRCGGRVRHREIRALRAYASRRHPGADGFSLSAVGAKVTIPLNLGPACYPIALVLTALPTPAAGGVLYRQRV